MSALRTLRGLFKGKDKDAGSSSAHQLSPGSGDPLEPPSMFSECKNTRKKYHILDFEPIGSLGKGSFGHVYLVKKRVRPGGIFTESDLLASPREFALKVISKQMVLDKGKVKDVFTERKILQREGATPFVVNLYYAFQNDHFLFFAMDNGAGGDFAGYLSKLPSMKMDEHRAKMFAAEVFVGLTYLHKVGVMYRDLKPENILISGSGHVMLCDFGLSKLLDDPKLGDEVGAGSTFVGSPYYVAPDVLRQTPYSWAVDWWSFGVLIYHVLCGRPPFGGRTLKEIFQKILFRELLWPQGVEETLSPEARDLCRRLLDKDPAKRAKDDEVRKHPWFAGVDFAAIKQNASSGGPSPWAQPYQMPAAKQLTREDIAIFDAYDEPDAMVVDNFNPDTQFEGFSQVAPLPAAEDDF